MRINLGQKSGSQAKAWSCLAFNAVVVEVVHQAASAMTWPRSRQAAIATHKAGQILRTF